MVVISRISAAAMAMRLSHPHAFVALVCFFLAGACVPVFVFVLAVVLVESLLLTSFMLDALSVVVLCSLSVSVTRVLAWIDAPGFVFKVCVSFPPDHVAMLVKYGVSMMDVVSMVSLSICIWGSSICTVVSFCITSVRLDWRTEVVSCRRTVSVLYTFVCASSVTVCLVMDCLVVPHPAMIIMARQVMNIASMVIFHFICCPRFLLVGFVLVSVALWLWLEPDSFPIRVGQFAPSDSFESGQPSFPVFCVPGSTLAYRLNIDVSPLLELFEELRRILVS